jgi:hypothetical protein
MSLVHGVETETERLARETRQKEDATQQQKEMIHHKYVQSWSKVSCSICKWWKREGRDTRKSRISLCTISWHKLDKGETMEDEE